MKKHLVIIVLLALTFPVFAQVEYLISGEIENGGFGGPCVKMNTFDGDLGVMAGGRGGWVLNHSLVIGGGGYGQVTEHDYLYSGDTYNLEVGYGGLEMEYMFNSNKLIHFSLYSLIGGGEVMLSLDQTYMNNHGNSDRFFAFEPACFAILNVTEWLKISAGISYLMVTGIDELGLTNNDIGGVHGMISFRFGSF